jgi:acetyltransferase-like isoleucine patch superfamily enzyme
MVIYYIFKGIISTLKNKLRSIYRYALIKSKYPTGLYDLTSQITECEFEKYVVIFNNTILYNSKIGAYTYIQMNGRVFNCDIGRFCSIAASVSIAPGMHDMSKVTTHPSFYFYTKALPKLFVTENKLQLFQRVIIGHDVWIGEKVVIIDGVKIGNGAVIASGAIVVKDVEPYSVVGGVPAKHIKYRFDTETIDVIQNSKWWNYSEEWFEKNAELLLNPIEFLKYLKSNESNN